jgi:two-component system phosphate regulon response regulator PhoB
MAEGKIMIVEDDPMMADTIASMLELYGYETVIFHDAQKAVDAIPTERPGLMMLDQNLPGGLTGIDICRRVKSDPQTQSTPVIIASAENQPEVVADAKAAGVSRYLVKPVGLDDLERAIAETLKEQRDNSDQAQE